MICPQIPQPLKRPPAHRFSVDYVQLCHFPAMDAVLHALDRLCAELARGFFALSGTRA